MTDEPGTLAAALVAALAELTTIDKGRTVDTGSYSYGYADLADLVDATRPVLARHGLVALTPVHGHDDGLAVTVTLYHRGGEVLAFPPLPFPPGRDAQSTGSAMTYFRRYALLAALGMATRDPDPIRDPGDDDGATAIPDPAPAARKRLGHRVHALGEPRRNALRAWLKAEELPDRAAEMDLDQIARVNGWLDDGKT